uniref:Fatty acid oxidation complex subunit alpha n=1 Tax=Magallana gigas TaxID=29159 RepID=K1Q4Y7_MAGGI
MGITVEFHEDGCAIITMRNGQNRWNPTSLKQFKEALDEVERKDSVKILVTTGVGKFYSNGIDLDYLKAHESEREQFSNDLVELFWRLMYFPLPTVAAINGHCFAGGAFFALCHDYRVMRHKMNAEALRESTIFAKRITGPEAVRLKMVDATAAESDLISKSKSVGFEALGSNVIQRVDLHNMKKDLFPRSDVHRKSNL